MPTEYEKIELPKSYLDQLKQKRAVVAISGKSGCGNTTVTKLLAKTLDLSMVNYTFRNLAAEEGVSLETIIERAKANPEIDRHVDRRQAELAEQGSCVLGSRLAIWVCKNAHLKVYLTADVSVRAARIRQREGGDLDAVLAATLARDKADRQRYMDLYGIDNDDPTAADLVIDAGSLTPPQIVRKITDALESRLGLTE